MQKGQRSPKMANAEVFVVAVVVMTTVTTAFAFPLRLSPNFITDKLGGGKALNIDRDKGPALSTADYEKEDIATLQEVPTIGPTPTIVDNHGNESTPLPVMCGYCRLPDCSSSLTACSQFCETHCR